MVVGRPGAPSVRPARPVGIVIEGEAGDPQLVEEIAHLGDVAAIERQRDDLEAIAAEPGLQAVERGHLVTARRAPRGPEVQHHHLAPKVGEADLVARAVEEGYLGYRLGLGRCEVERGGR